MQQQQQQLNNNSPPPPPQQQPEDGLENDPTTRLKMEMSDPNPNSVPQNSSPDANCNCFLCNQCPLSFDTLEALEHHLMNAHADGDNMGSMMGDEDDDVMNDG